MKKLLGVSNYNLGKASGLDRKVHNIFFTIPGKNRSIYGDNSTASLYLLVHDLKVRLQI